MGITDRTGELSVEVILHPAEIVFRISASFCHDAGVRLQPSGIVFYKLSRLRSSQILLCPGSERLSEIFRFKAYHLRIVYGGKCVQLVAALKILPVLFHSDIGQMYIQRMKCKCGDRIVRVGIVPISVSGSIVYRENLQNLLSGAFHPIDKTRDIVEFSYSKTLLTT